jgi:hypothetical protein
MRALADDASNMIKRPTLADRDTRTVDLRCYDGQKKCEKLMRAA